MQVYPSQQYLAARLRGLREAGLGGTRVTQRELAEAFSSHRKIGTSSISSWEGGKAVPPEDWLDVYSTLFATERSVASGEVRLLAETELTADERERRRALHFELIGLRDEALGAPASRPATSNPWIMEDGEPIVLVCAPLPQEFLERMPYADPKDPDYIELYTYSDLDALAELHGHIRAFNPDTKVEWRRADRLVPDDYTSHLVLLGGVDWNELTRTVLDEVNLAVQQVSSGDKDAGHFAVVEEGESRIFAPTMTSGAGPPELLEDVAHFYRGISPFNADRTVTICNGMYGRGVLGAVRTLTDERFRDRNSGYVEERFGSTDSYSILARVRIVAGQVITPDWSKADTRLHEWPAPDA